MAKRAVVFGINAYPLPADALKAPVDEAKRWESLLSYEYGFEGNVVRIPEPETTRPRVLSELRTLLTNVGQNDQLVFCFCGHGGDAFGWETDTAYGTRKEHALILYGPYESTGFQESTITPSDVERILKDQKPPKTARFTFIVDACFAEKFGDGESTSIEANPVVLFIPNAVPGVGDEEALGFADMSRRLQGEDFAAPLYLAAARATEVAQEVGPDDYRRMAFSSTANNRLSLAFDMKQPISSTTLIEFVNQNVSGQTAVAIPETGLPDELFAGGLRPQTQSAVFQPQFTSQSDATGRSVVASAVDSLDVRVIGLATFIELSESDNPTYRTRIVFPLDTWADSEPKRHRGFIEVANKDMAGPPAGVPAMIQYHRGGVVYSRWPLRKHLVRFANVDGFGQPVERSPSFKYHVPSLPEVTPGLDRQPRRACIREYVDPTLFTGFVDFQAGSVTIGELETEPTKFKRQYSGTETWHPPRKTPISVLLTIPLTMHYVAIVLSTDGKTPLTTIFVNSGSTILVGNAREADITGTGSGEGPREHFLVYYYLGEGVPPLPVDPGLPHTPAIPINACTVTTWP